LRPALLVLLVGCHTAQSRPLVTGHTLLVDDGQVTVAVAWDGSTARVYQAGRAIDEYPAESRIQAVWGCRPEGLGPARQVRTFDHALGADEVAALTRCPVDAPGCELASAR
jgi:hypothetical protein